MNRQDIEQKLSGIQFEKFVIPQSHKQKLKVALFAYASSSRPSMVLWTKEEFKKMVTQFKPVSFIAGVVLGAFVISGAQAVNNSPLIAKYNPFATQEAQAKAEVKTMLFKARALSPEQRAEIESHMKADMQASLEEALAAKDLTYISADDEAFGSVGVFKIATAGVAAPEGATITSARTTAGPTGMMAAGTVSVQNDGSMEIVKRMKYTNKEGATVVLGINKENFPVFKMITLTAEMQQKIQAQMQENGNAGFGGEGRAIQLRKFEGGEAGGEGAVFNISGEASEAGVMAVPAIGHPFDIKFETK